MCACLATLMSGVACMFYQLAWVRELTNVTTAATVALVLVLAAFMAGLGIGAWLGGRVVRRVRRPLLAYAVIELAAAALFLLGIPLLQASLQLQAATSLAVQLVAVGLYLVAATTLLGMTLPLLIAGLAAQPATASLVTREAAYNFIYGINTAGALAGCLLCGYVTIELVGLDRSILLGVACSLASALGAFLIGPARTAPASADAPRTTSISPRLLAVVAATGAIEGDLARAPTSVRLRYEYRQLILAWSEVTRATPARRDQILLRGMAHDADFGEAMVNLAIAYAERRQLPEAIALAQRARTIPRTRASADALLAKLGAR